MGDEGTSTHVLVEHRKAENELEELQLTKSDKSNRGRRGPKLLIRRLSGKNQLKEFT